MKSWKSRAVTGVDNRVAPDYVMGLKAIHQGRGTARVNARPILVRKSPLLVGHNTTLRLHSC